MKKHKEKRKKRGLLHLLLFSSQREEPTPPPSEDGAQEKCTVVEITIDADIPKYAGNFLRPHYLHNRATFYIEREVLDVLQKVVKRIGDKGLTTSGYIDNILRDHLAAHKAEINQISRDNADVL